MRKIRLELDELSVESFATTPAPDPRLGTVHGNETALRTACSEPSCDTICASCDTFCQAQTDYGAGCPGVGTTITAGDLCGTDPNFCGTQGGGPSCWNECVITVGPGECPSEISACDYCM